MIRRSAPWWRRRFGAWAIAGILALVVGPIVGAFAVTKDNSPRLDPPADRVRDAITAMRADHFYIAPELRYRLTAPQREAIEQRLRSARVPAYLILWTDTATGGYPDDYTALHQLMAGVGVDGHYAIVDERGNVTAAARGMESAYVDTDVMQNRLPTALLDYASAMAQAPAQAQPAPDDYWGGKGGGLAAGLLFAALTFGGLMLVIPLSGFAIRRYLR